MSDSDDEGRFRQTGWPGLRGRLFHTFFLLSRPMTLGVRALVLDLSNQSVFLIRHTYVPGWHLPGGGVERGETTLGALERELMEEANVVLTGKPELRSMHANQHASPRDHVAFYLVTDFRQTGPRAPDYEIAEAAFFPVADLPADATPATRRRLAEVLDKSEISAFW